jgi:uncharacterized protein YjiS (DUF1127 family)
MSIREFFYRWRKYQQTVRELETDSPGELTELGIAVADIAPIATSAAASECPATTDRERTGIGSALPTHSTPPRLSPTLR